MGDVLWELLAEEIVAAGGGEHGLPPGFRFHPTDEELVTFYLASKVFNGACCGVDIAEVDLNRCEPWELPDAARMGEREWYFFSLRDRKYPTGLRTNRATGAGYWKATGKDREVRNAATGALLGMKKTLVFYKGRAPRGEKTRWVLHEYRLDGDFASVRLACKEEWVICRIFHKAGDQLNKMMMVLKSPLCYMPTSSFQDPPPPFPNPSFTSFLHDLQTLHTPLQSHNNGSISNSSSSNNNNDFHYMQQQGCNPCMLPAMPPLPSITSVLAGRGAPQAQPGVNAGQQEPAGPTGWLEAYLYEMGPPASADVHFHPQGPHP